MAQPAHGQMLYQMQLQPQQQQIVQYSVGSLSNEQYQGQAPGPRYAAPALPLPAPGEAAGMSFWQQQPASAAASGANPPALMQFAGAPAPQLGPGGVLGGPRSAYDMQQLMYMLPPGGGVPSAGPAPAPHHGLSSGMVLQSVGPLGPAGAASGHLWAHGTGSGGGVLLSGQQQLGNPSLTNSGSLIEGPSDTDFLTGASAASSAQAPYMGWLY
jgi:hypothetical protein